MATDPRDARIEALEAQVAILKADSTTYYASGNARKSLRGGKMVELADEGASAKHVKEYILQEHELDVSIWLDRFFSFPLLLLTASFFLSSPFVVQTPSQHFVLRQCCVRAGRG